MSKYWLQTQMTSFMESIQVSCCSVSSDTWLFCNGMTSFMEFMQVSCFSVSSDTWLFCYATDVVRRQMELVEWYHESKEELFLFSIKNTSSLRGSRQGWPEALDEDWQILIWGAYDIYSYWLLKLQVLIIRAILIKGEMFHLVL